MDDGTFTKQITSAGDTLYILKGDGVISRHYIQPMDGNGGVNVGQFAIVDERPDTQEISSSGAVLYILKVDGTIWQYAPTISGQIEIIHKAKDAISIKANGGTLYFIRNDGTTWQYKDQQIPILIENSRKARVVDAFNGFVYILTDEHKIFRRSPVTNRWDELEKANANNKKLAAFGQDLFVIKEDKSVYRYSEFILER